MEVSLTQEQKNSIANYKRMGIEFEILDEDKVKITQTRLINGYLLCQKQLVERAREIFPGKWRIIPVVYFLNVHEINQDWIKEKMREFGIKPKDFIKQLAIDKENLKLYLSGKRKLDKQLKASFFYYFLAFEINRDFREESI